MAKIDAIQNFNNYRVQSVNLFENNYKSNTQNNLFQTGLFSQQSNDVYNVNHPRVRGSETQALNIDYLA